MDDNIKEQLNRIEHDTSRTARAVFGEPEAGHPGLVHDMAQMKEFREKQMLKSAGVAGGMAVVVIAAKGLWSKLFP